MSEAYRIKFILPNGEITIRDLSFSQTVETTGALDKETADKFWHRQAEVNLPTGTGRPWQGCKAWLVAEGV
jgi:hypothetical protein